MLIIVVSVLLNVILCQAQNAPGKRSHSDAGLLFLSERGGSIDTLLGP
jgi:hypothetical protein